MAQVRRSVTNLALLALTLTSMACGQSTPTPFATPTGPEPTSSDGQSTTTFVPSSTGSPARTASIAPSGSPITVPGPFGPLLPGMPAYSDPANIYAADGAADLSPAVVGDVPLVYVPNAGSNTVSEIDPVTHRVVRTFAVAANPMHIVPSYDLRTLWVTSEVGNRLTPIDPRTGRPGKAIVVRDPYNMYFTPDGRFAIVVAEARRQLQFRSAASMALVRVVSVPCRGVDHADFTADGRTMLMSCEFASSLLVVDVVRQRAVRTLKLPSHGQPQDVKLSPDGRTFYVSDLIAGGVWELDASSLAITGFIHTGAGAHGLYVSRDFRSLYVANRGAGSISVVDFATRRVRATWHLPGGGSPDMGNVSADGKVLWLSGRYDGVVYAIDTATGHLLARVRVGTGPHGVCVWPQPGRYSIGHTGILR